MSESPVFDSENLKKIQWSQESLTLSNFVSRYPLPQLVQIEEGYHGGSDENSLSAGQVLKIHTATTERKVKCYDRHEKELHVPLHIGTKVVLRPENYDTVYQRVSDLSRAKPLPPYVEVTRGYYNVDSNVDYELSVEPGDKLEVLSDNTSLNLVRLQKRNKSMSFRTMEGVDIKIPFDCVAGFKPLIDNLEHSLADVIPNEINGRAYPFYFEFLSDNEGQHRNLGVLKCANTYDDRLIIASSGTSGQQVVFMIPNNLEVTVKVAVGTLQNDPAYENIRSSFHNFETIENDVHSSRVSQIFRSQSQILGFSYTPGTADAAKYTGWETFESPPPPYKRYNSQELTSEEIYEKEKIEKRKSLDVVALPTKAEKQQKDEPANFAPKPSTISQGTLSKGAALRRQASEDGSHQNRTSQAGSHATNVEQEANPVEKMSVAEICESLKTLNMNMHVDIFTENQIDGVLLNRLDFDDLQELGLKRLEIKKIFSFRDGWKPKLV